MYAKLPSYSDNFLGGRIDRVRVFWVGAAGAAGAASARLAAPTTRRRFVGLFAALCEAFRLRLFGVLRDFCEVSASRCSFLSARAAASSSAFAFLSSRRSSAARCRSARAACCCCFYYNFEASLNSLSRAFWSCCCSASSCSAALRSRCLCNILGLHHTAPP
jgi:hypothetical protein